MEFIKRNWKLLISALGSLIGLFLLKDFFQKDLKAELKNTEANKQDALLEQDKERVKEQADKLNKDTEALREDLKDAPKDMTAEEAEKYWSK